MSGLFPAKVKAVLLTDRLPGAEILILEEATVDRVHFKSESESVKIDNQDVRCIFHLKVYMKEDFRVRYIYPIHLNVLHGNFLGKTGKSLDTFLNSTKVALDEITDKELILMYHSDWRAAMVASWLCGIRRFSQYASKIETLLIPSRTCYAGELHCFALARFDNDESVRILRSYLNTYLPIDDRIYDQLWAIGALRWLDGRNGKDYADFYLGNPDNWKFTDRGIDGIKNPEAVILGFERVMKFVDRHLADYST